MELVTNLMPQETGRKGKASG